MNKGIYRIFSQIIGELLLCSPIIAISCFFDLWFDCILIIICILIYKSFYKYGLHFNKDTYCLAVSYVAIILNLIVCYVFDGQYFLIIINCNLIAALSCKLGEIIYKATRLEYIEKEYTLLKDRYENIESFDVDNCNKEQLVKRCNELKFSKDKIDLCIKMFIDKVPYNDLADEYCIESSSIAIRKMRLKKKLNK